MVEEKQFSRRKEGGGVETPEEKKARISRGKEGKDTTSKLIETKEPAKRETDLPEINLSTQRTSDQTDPTSLDPVTLTQSKADADAQEQEQKEIALKTGAAFVAGGAIGAAIGLAIPIGAGVGGSATTAAITSTNIQQLTATATITSQTAGVVTYGVNTATVAATTTWLAKLGAALTSPTAIAGGLVATIGTYPFAGFIKEESLQTLSFGVRSAIESGNEEGAKIALEQQKELLNPGLWEKMLEKIPYANVLSSLKNFYSAANTKIAIDEKIIENMNTGEDSDTKWERLRQEEADQDKATVDYYNEQRKLMVQWEREAEKAALKEDAAFWRKEKEAQSKKEAEDRKAIAEFWNAYRKEQQKLSEDTRPSNLNFGLI